LLGRQGTPVPAAKRFKLIKMRAKTKRAGTFRLRPFGIPEFDSKRSGVRTQIIGDDADLLFASFHTELEYVLH
jgi:hypothetical protein